MKRFLVMSGRTRKLAGAVCLVGAWTLQSFFIPWVEEESNFGLPSLLTLYHGQTNSVAAERHLDLIHFSKTILAELVPDYYYAAGNPLDSLYKEAEKVEIWNLARTLEAQYLAITDSAVGHVGLRDPDKTMSELREEHTRRALPRLIEKIENASIHRFWLGPMRVAASVLYIVGTIVLIFASPEPSRRP